MTTINEMDELFDFNLAAGEDAFGATDNCDFLNQSGFGDIDHCFGENNNLFDSHGNFTELPYFTPEQQLSIDLHDASFPSHLENENMGPADFTDFPRWIEGMNVPSRPCDHCAGKNIHCKVIREGFLEGSCTSCVALNTTCSLLLVNKAARGGEGMGDVLEAGDFEIMGSLDIDRSSMEDLTDSSRNVSVPDLAAMREEAGAEEVNPKVGARFSREALRVLRGWLSSHHKHPYPSDEEKESLRRQTGLNKTQIINWLANARRRGKVRAPRSISPSPHQFSSPLDIPRRSGTPAPRDNFTPLERWKHSPPEHEPASVTAIAKAVRSSNFSGHDSPYTNSYGHTDDGSARSLFNVSSASSLGTSHGTSHSSGGSFASAFSHKSRGSFGSYNSLNAPRGRRRRRRQIPKAVKSNVMPGPAKTFQCTFCTESFKTKHDWQRHEKSLHLSLERWVCSPSGHTQIKAESNSLCCVYCGIANPVKGHEELHNHSSCAERTLEERTFYRKDHLRQHLNLVHEAKFQAWSMDSWKVATPEIRSRCGFCGIVMQSWTARVDHLAEHFKSGKSMSDWKGDWGFDSHVVDIVENGMPPYLIHDERNSTNPFTVTNRNLTNGAASTLEDRLKVHLVDYINNQVILGAVPTDEDLMGQARQAILIIEALKDSPPEASWFRDLIMSPESGGRNPSHRSIHGHPTTSDDTGPRPDKRESINTLMDLDSITCVKERALKQYVRNRQALGLIPTDAELQVEACKILDEGEATSHFKCRGANQWFKYLITSSSKWLTDFRRRAVLPRSEEMANELVRSQDDKTIDYSIHNYHRLERELIDFVNQERAAGRSPTDADLQRTARMIIYGDDDSWNQTAADDPNFLEVFKRQNGLAVIDENEVLQLPEPTILGTLGLSLLASNGSPPPSTPSSLHWDLENTGIGQPSPQQSSSYSATNISRISPSSELHTSSVNQPSTNTNPTQPLRYFLNDANCYGRLVRELSRFVTACTSPNNPTSHTPTDAEIQNQARWIIYDDDDPWNQTAADNAEWLVRFKRDIGLLPRDEGPGLPHSQLSWQVSGGGSGFSPPYLHPSQEAKFGEYKEDVPVKMDSRLFNVNPNVAGHYVKSIAEGRYRKIASVFCSRDLENGLSAFVEDFKRQGMTPTDAQLRAKAQQILGVEKTAADEQELLEKFKALHNLPPSPGYTPPLTNSSSASGPGPISNFDLPNFSSDVDMLADFELDTTLQSYDFSPYTLPPMGGSCIVSAPPVPMGINVHGETFEGGIHEMEETIGIEGLSTHDRMGRIMPLLSEDIGSEREWADSHRVYGTTASPLRRRASERLAGAMGHSLEGSGLMGMGLA